MDISGGLTEGSAKKAAAGKKGRKQISANVKALVCARAAGRCQYGGCNKSLIGDPISGTPDANGAYIAHIVAAEPDGPRGDPILSPKLATEPSNLMLVCDVHHRVFDRKKEAEHPAELLLEMKRRHEDRIAIVTAIDEDRGSHVLRYAAPIGPNESPVAVGDLKLAMLPDRYPVDAGWIDLDVVNLAIPDHEAEFWHIHLRNLRKGFAEKVRGRLERQEIKRLTVFGLAPTPLLIELGRLLSDIANAEVRQLLRHPKGWRWQDGDAPISLSVTRPASTGKTVGAA
jgi:SMODS-associated and fused to various effectors sensor domain